MFATNLKKSQSTTRTRRKGSQDLNLTEQPPPRPTLPSVQSGALKEHEDGLYLTGLVCQKPVYFLVDTGANIAIVKASCLKDIPTFGKPELRPMVERMSLADQSSLPFVGQGIYRLQFRDTQVEHPVQVVDIECEGILGLDFLWNHGCELGNKSRHYKLTMGNTHGNHPQRPVSPCCLWVTVDQTTVILPKNEAMV